MIVKVILWAWFIILINRKPFIFLKTIFYHIVPRKVDKSRITEYILAHFPHFHSKKSIQKAIKRKEIIVDGIATTTAHFVMHGNKIELLETPSKIKDYDLKLNIVHEDVYLAIVEKPAGLTVSGNLLRSLTNALSQNLRLSTSIDVLARPLPAHRLDKQTSGLVVVGKTRKAIQALGTLFQENKIDKTYIALVSGHCKKEGIINLEINGKEAISHYKVIKKMESAAVGKYSLVELKPKTGRTHQIRIHLAHIGHPVIGDKIYNYGHTRNARGLYLRAIKICFLHPITGIFIESKIEMSKKFKKFIKYHNLTHD